MKISRVIAGVAALALSAGVAVASSTLNGPNGAPPSQGVGGTALGVAFLHAVVNADGTTARGDGNQSSTKLSTGTYDVRFQRNITACAFIGTAGLAAFSGSIPSTVVTVVGRVGTTNGVFVQTFNSSGVLVDTGFHLMIKCG